MSEVREEIKAIVEAMFDDVDEADRALEFLGGHEEFQQFVTMLEDDQIETLDGGSLTAVIAGALVNMN